MPDTDPIPRRIADEAARWFADRDAGLLNDEAALAAWLAADPRHARAFAEIEAVWADMGAVPVAHDVRASLAPPARHATRRGQWRGPLQRRWLPAAAAASVALLVGGVALDLPTRLRADAITATGEQRTLTLADGSRVTLNTGSAIAFEATPERRTVRLLRGEALFKVAPDRNRPFTVESGGGAATALGTQFVVRTDGDTTRVTVTEHRVRVRYAGAIDVGEGRSVGYGADAGLGTPQPVNIADAVAWTQGALVFENRPLAEVVAELDRYHPGLIRLIGDAARNRRVSGVFRIDDPLGAIEKLRHSLGLRSTRITDRIVFLYA